MIIINAKSETNPVLLASTVVTPEVLIVMNSVELGVLYDLKARISVGSMKSLH